MVESGPDIEDILTRPYLDLGAYSVRGGVIKSPSFTWGSPSPGGDVRALNLDPNNVEEILNQLLYAQADNVGGGLYSAYVKLSVWADTGSAKSLESQLFIPRITPPTDVRGEKLQVFDPYNVVMWDLTENKLGEQSQENGYFWQLARREGVNKILRIHFPPRKDIREINTKYNGFTRMEYPEEYGVGINHEVDTHIGNLEFSVDVVMKGSPL